MLERDGAREHREELLECHGNYHEKEQESNTQWSKAGARAREYRGIAIARQ